MAKFNITVIGGGHAGIEAACIAAKMGASVLLITGNAGLIGEMSCNPAIGGVAKGNIVREIDALGGTMASLADRAGVQFLMLNAGKGSAVWGPRAQVDRALYRDLARKTVENNPNITILQGTAAKIGASGGKVRSVILENGEKIDTEAVIVAAGTFLNGIVYVGHDTHPGGRAGEPAAAGLTESLKELGISSGRLRTSSPPRVDRRTVNFSRLTVQEGDAEPWPFSFFTKGKLVNKAVCWETKTNSVTHGYILDGLERLELGLMVTSNSTSTSKDKIKGRGEVSPTLQPIQNGQKDAHFELFSATPSAGTPRNAPIYSPPPAVPLQKEEGDIGKPVSQSQNKENFGELGSQNEEGIGEYQNIVGKPGSQSQNGEGVGGVVDVSRETLGILTSSLEKKSVEKMEVSGPRYCPSIEDKIIRFGERDGHILYLEPETLDGHDIYINGLTTALPYDVQERMVRSIYGLEDARIIRPGYGIEYDYFPPAQLRPTLESRTVQGLFFAGQVNGTSGYEEAACQGLMAGINAVAALRGEEPVVLGRDTSYIGVLIDDLVTKGTDEPYRMFTSRAEYRLILRQDNCDERLMPIARKLSLITPERYDSRRRFWDRKRELAKRLADARVTPEQYGRIAGGTISQAAPASELLKRPEVGLGKLLEIIGADINVAADDVDNSAACGQNVDTLCTSTNSPVLLFDKYLTLGVESDIKYEGFVRKQLKEIEKLRRLEDTRIPDDFPYDDIPGLLAESRQKLKKIRPHTLSQAARISGLTPADLLIMSMRVVGVKLKSLKSKD